MKNIPVLTVSGPTLAMAYERALVELYTNGTRFRTQYDKPGDPESLDATMDITVDDPMADPMIHKAFPGGLEDLREYVMELEGAKDTWVKCINDPKDTRWEYTYHQRLAKHGQWKEMVEIKDCSCWKDNKKCDHGVSDVVLNGKPINQIDYVVDKLARQPFTRQAQMITWMPHIDLDCYDPPCLQRIWVRVMEDNDGTWWLNYNINFRSNDAWGAYMMNSFGLTMMINDLVAGPLAEKAGRTVRLGRMNWHADSWHVYGKDIDQMRARLLDRIPTTDFGDRVINFRDELTQEIYRECEPALMAKIDAKTAEFAKESQP